ncbi:hypothetical protein [Qipengyuania sp. JC766]|uniref:NAD(P)/FAD-dependent oxidoreductase n=1 Tax=Qipengyuania sp. JC766 TaxID=3232139 RepID=UPI003459D53B
MRGEDPLTRPIILGAGPAGCAAAITLGRKGARPLLIDRDEIVGDALCGGFMSWRTAQTVGTLGVDLASLGARPVNRLALFAASKRVETRLPATAYGLSRRAFDTALRRAALDAGAGLEIDRARTIAPGRVMGECEDWTGDALFLATGKHDIRGSSRPRSASDPALGLRVRVPASKRFDREVGDRIELHLFDGGYAGIVLQEDGSANVCLAVRKSRLHDAGGSPVALLDVLCETHPVFAARMENRPSDGAIDTIGAVPYGWIAEDTQDGIYRLGDQAAVIPSLAGEGMSIAIASGIMGAQAYLAGTGAPTFQAEFARRASGPVRRAERIWHSAENTRIAPWALAFLSAVPAAADWAMRTTRIAQPAQ